MVSIWNRLWWGGDPDQRDEITGLSLRDLYHIKRSWAVMYAEQDKCGMQLFLRLFRLDPATQDFFKLIRNKTEDEITKSFQFKAHVIALMSALNSAITNLHQPEVVIALMNRLGETHHQRFVKRLYFKELKTVLMNMLHDDLRQNDVTIESWGRFVTFIYTHIFETL